MTIKVFTQGKYWKTDRELFSLVGHWLVDLNIHEKLGTAITTQKDDIWFVSLTEKGDPRGFATGRVMKNGGLHIRFVHCPDDAPLMCKAMIKKFVDHAGKEQLKTVWTNDKPGNPFWPEFGFKFTARARGNYGRWEKEVRK